MITGIIVTRSDKIGTIAHQNLIKFYLFEVK